MYPADIYEPRVMVNLPGVEYFETTYMRIFAEDFNNDRDNIVAIQETLGLNPQGEEESVVARLEALEAALADKVDLSSIYKVGDIFISVSSENPSVKFGGTWVAFGAGKTLISLNPGDADFNTAEETGGEKAVTLTAAQSGLRSHGHSLTTQVLYRKADGTGSYNTATSGTRAIGVAEAEDVAAAAASESHNNLPPYIVVYMWKKTA